MIIITSDVTPEPSLDEVELYPEPKRRKSLNKTSLNPEGIQQCVEFVAVVLYLRQKKLFYYQSYAKTVVKFSPYT